MDYKPNAVQDLASRMRQRLTQAGPPQVPAAQVAVDKNRVGQFKVLGTGKIVTLWFSRQHQAVVLRARNDLKYQRYFGNPAATILVDVGYYIGLGVYRWEVRDPYKSAEVREFIVHHFPLQGTLPWNSSKP